MSYVYKYLITALWLSWLIYWRVSAGTVKGSVRIESAASRASHFTPLGLGLLLMAWPDESEGFFFAHCWEQTPFAFWSGAFLTLAGLSFAVWARVVLGRNWSHAVTVKESHELVRSGPYARIRHPIYTGILTALLGTAVAMSEWRGFLAVLLVLLAFTIKLRLEERWMTEVFGPVYETYRLRSGALLPKLG